MLKAKLAPSLMCADFLELRRQLGELGEQGVEYLHLDIMDGHFVPNLMLGNGLLQAVRRATDIPFDYHFMTEKPENMLDWFEIRNGDLVSVHIESTPHICKALRRIREKGARGGVALNPGTPAAALEYLVDELDFVLVMTVNPGFAGQSLVASALPKISAVRALLDAAGREDAMVEVDGNVSFDNAMRMRARGADLFVAGTSSIFGERPLKEGIAKLREYLERGEAQ